MLVFMAFVLTTSLLFTRDSKATEAQFADRRVLRQYPAKKDACYVQLKPDWERGVAGSRTPVCTALLENFNRFCKESPMRGPPKIHTSTQNIQEPRWSALDVASNMDLAMEILLPRDPAKRKFQLQKIERNVRSSVAESRLRLDQAEIAGNEFAAELTLPISVYRLRWCERGIDDWYNAPPVNMFSKSGERRQAKAFEHVTRFSAEGTLWKYASKWYLVKVATDNRILVSELTRNPGPTFGVVSLEACTFQHVSEKGSN